MCQDGGSFTVWKETMIGFAQISDLHFGYVLANTGRGAIPHQRPHDLAKCLALPGAIDAAMMTAQLPDGAPTRVVASGDLSVSGTAAQFAVAHAYLRSEVAINRFPAPYGVMGLKLSPDDLHVVPGNHDHWDGNRTNTSPYNGNLFDEQFRITPWKKTWQSAEGLELEVFGIDSNSGWNPQVSGISRHATGGLFARGLISDAEFQSLEALLIQSNTLGAKRVRAIVCHHSVSYRGGRLRKLELDPSCRDRLVELAGRYRVAAILTGHVHDSHYSTAPGVGYDGKVWPVNELRCSSTLGWPDTASDENGFLFHRIAGFKSQWEWRVWRYGWDGVGYVCGSQRPWHRFSGSF